RGVTLGYGYSLDNTAYAGIAGYGLQRGAMVITVKPDGTWTQVHKNAYTDYGCDTDAFIHVNLDDYLYPDFAPANK
ncbi:MAG: hypothetical protein II473_01835, partial [Clostridia bacterium]|nr:hypothetical protein [Clostridia bacterium]